MDGGLFGKGRGDEIVVDATKKRWYIDNEKGVAVEQRFALLIGY